MFKLEELTGRHELEEKKTNDMESGISLLKSNLNELDEASSKIILIEEDLRKEFRLIEEESKKSSDKGPMDNSIVAAIMSERYSN